MTASCSVSVVIPVLNGAATIGDALAALRAQTGVSGEVEVIVVDNGSTDGTPEVVRRFGAVLLDEPTPGPSAARNRGIRAARGDVIAHLDADTVPTRRWLAELVAPFSDPRVLLVGGRTMSFPSDNPIERYTEQSGRFEPENSVHRAIFPFVPSGNLGVRREAALAIGGWSEDMLTAEDVDFSHRLLRGFPGTEIVYRPAAILLHRERASDKALCKQAWTYGEGAADMYRRYPEVVRWDWAKTARLAAVLTRRGILPAALRLGTALGLASRERAEFARYHRLWTWWWWRGFFSMYRRRERRALP